MEDLPTPSNNNQHLRKQVLVTGVTGFIGSNLVNELLKQGFTVRGAIRPKQSHEKLKPIDMFECDLLDNQSLAGIENGIAYAIHSAGLQGKWGIPDQHLHQVNVEGSLRLLERFQNGGLRLFIYLSAGGVTGPAEQTEVDESYPCNPVTPYEKSKFEAESQLKARAKELGIPLIVVRPTFTYGPTDPHKLPMFKAIKKGLYAFIGAGDSVLHPVYIDDLLSGILLAMEKGQSGETYIIGGARPVTNKEMIFTIADNLGVRRPWIRIPEKLATPIAYMLEALGRRFGFQPILTPSRVLMMGRNFGYSIRHAESSLGYRPKTDFQTGIRKTIEFYTAKGLL